jgi:hypothetical protein
VASSLRTRKTSSVEITSRAWRLWAPIGSPAAAHALTGISSKDITIDTATDTHLRRRWLLPAAINRPASGNPLNLAPAASAPALSAAAASVPAPSSVAVSAQAPSAATASRRCPRPPQRPRRHPRQLQQPPVALGRRSLPAGVGAPAAMCVMQIGVRRELPVRDAVWPV